MNPSYTEKLYLMPGMNTYFFEPILKKKYDRNYFDLLNSDNIYLCPQTLYKLHPDMDTIFLEILELDPSAKLVLIEGAEMKWTETFSERLSGAMERRNKQHLDRVVVVKRLNTDEFLSLCRIANVILDPFPVSPQIFWKHQLFSSPLSSI